MNLTFSKTPNVLCLSGHDPSGGAGIQADIESINQCGGHSLSIISCHTVQDSQQVYQVIPSDIAILQKQINTIVDDSIIFAIKIGLIANTEIIDCIVTSLKTINTHKQANASLASAYSAPVILDPVFSSGGSNQAISKQTLINYLKKHLLPKVHIITPNTKELKQLTNENNPDIAAKQLLSLGVNYVLLTGTHDESTKDVINTLYSKNTKKTWAWPRLNGVYHGSGCTLASSLSAYIAQGVDTTEACSLAQEYTWKSLQSAYQSGQGQQTPNRKQSC